MTTRGPCALPTHRPATRSEQRQERKLARGVRHVHRFGRSGLHGFALEIIGAGGECRYTSPPSLPASRRATVRCRGRPPSSNPDRRRPASWKAWPAAARASRHRRCHGRPDWRWGSRRTRCAAPAAGRPRPDRTRTSYWGPLRPAPAGAGRGAASQRLCRRHAGDWTLFCHTGCDQLDHIGARLKGGASHQKRLGHGRVEAPTLRDAAGMEITARLRPLQ